MNTNDRKLRAAVAGLLTLGALGASSVIAAESGMEQCAGVVKAGHNDCATSQNACHSHVKTDANPMAWIYLPAGTCERIAGAHVVRVKDPSPGKNP